MATQSNGFPLTPSTLICNRIFEEKVRPFTDEDLTGWYFSVDLETEDYELDQDHLTAARRLRERRPPDNMFTIRIGYPAVFELGPRNTGRSFFDID